MLMCPLRPDKLWQNRGAAWKRWSLWVFVKSCRGLCETSRCTTNATATCSPLGLHTHAVSHSSLHLLIYNRFFPNLLLV